ncbi:hypothetical protein Tco_0413949 [Tanacetum coccineum]
MEEKLYRKVRQQAVLARIQSWVEAIRLVMGGLDANELAGGKTSFTIILNRPITHSFASGYPAATMSIDENQFLEVGAQLELHGSIPHYHMQRLDALLPTLFDGYEKDLRELYTRENHDLRRQIAKERREQLELTNRVARIERRQEFGRE